MPAIVSVNNLNKHFKIIKHHRGITGPLRNLATREFTIIKAVNGITFNINVNILHSKYSSPDSNNNQT